MHRKLDSRKNNNELIRFLLAWGALIFYFQCLIVEYMYIQYAGTIYWRSDSLLFKISVKARIIR